MSTLRVDPDISEQPITHRSTLSVPGGSSVEYWGDGSHVLVGASVATKATIIKADKPHEKVVVFVQPNDHFEYVGDYGRYQVVILNRDLFTADMYATFW